MLIPLVHWGLTEHVSDELRDHSDRDITVLAFEDGILDPDHAEELVGDLESVLEEFVNYGEGDIGEEVNKPSLGLEVDGSELRFHNLRVVDEETDELDGEGEVLEGGCDDSLS